MMHIENAIIKDTRIESEHCLSVWLTLEYDSGCQGFGGHVLYLPKECKHHKILSPAGHFIHRCMQIAGVDSWSRITGKAIRVAKDHDGLSGLVKGIGHIIKDDWFYPENDFTGINS